MIMVTTTAGQVTDIDGRHSSAIIRPSELMIYNVKVAA
jgi:hypothetical protein